MKYSIVIPNYNGSELLRKHFSNIFSFARQHGIEIIIVDDASQDDSVDYLRENYPDVRVIINDKNFGFGETCNKGIEGANGDFVFLFNTDIEILDIDMSLLETYLTRTDCFAVTFKSLYSDGVTFREGPKRLKIKTGLPLTLHNLEDNIKQQEGFYYSYYPVGGHCIINKKKFLDIGGFLDIYSPFYWEDADLGVRAIRRGWNIYYDNRFIVIHYHKDSSIKRNTNVNIINRIKLRNRIIFAYTNFTVFEKIFFFYPGMFIRSIENLLKMNLDFFRIWKEAKRRVNEYRAGEQ